MSAQRKSTAKGDCYRKASPLPICLSYFCLFKVFSPPLQSRTQPRLWDIEAVNEKGTEDILQLHAGLGLAVLHGQMGLRAEGGYPCSPTL